MLDIINGKIVTRTGEGTFEIDAKNAHRAITVHLLELMEDNTPEHTRENYIEAQKLYKIGAMVFKDAHITYDIVCEDLMPLMDCLIQDKAEGHLAYMVMRYVTREYVYRIKQKHELDALYDFFYLLRDPVYTTILREKPYFELFYRIENAFFDESKAERVENHCMETIYDYEYITKNQKLFDEAIRNNKPLPETDLSREYGKMVQGIVNMPYIVACWGAQLTNDGYISKDEYAPLRMYVDLYKKTYNPTAGSQKANVDQDYEFVYCKDKELSQTYSLASIKGCYNLCYYIALRIGSDSMRRATARNSGVRTKLYNDHNSIRRFTKSAVKAILVILAIYVGYRILKGIYDAINMPFAFWFIAIPCISAAFSTPESRAAAVEWSIRSPYRRARYEQAKEQNRQLKELNENIKKYNAKLDELNNGYRKF